MQFLMVRKHRVRVSTNHTYQEGDVDACRITGKETLERFWAKGETEAYEEAHRRIGVSSDTYELLRITPLA